jgi:hypothetical protein
LVLLATCSWTALASSGELAVTASSSIATGAVACSLSHSLQNSWSLSWHRLFILASRYTVQLRQNRASRRSLNHSLVGSMAVMS